MKILVLLPFIVWSHYFDFISQGQFALALKHLKNHPQTPLESDHIPVMIAGLKNQQKNRNIIGQRILRNRFSDLLNFYKNVAIDPTVFLELVKSEEDYIVEKLLKHPLTPVNFQNHSGKNPALLFIENEKVDLFKKLQKHPQFDPNLGDPAGNSPLSYALKMKSKISTLLLNNPRVDLQGQNIFGETLYSVFMEEPNFKHFHSLVSRKKDFIYFLKNSIRQKRSILIDYYNTYYPESSVLNELAIHQLLLLGIEQNDFYYFTNNFTAFYQTIKQNLPSYFKHALIKHQNPQFLDFFLSLPSDGEKTWTKMVIMLSEQNDLSYLQRYLKIKTRNQLTLHLNLSIIVKHAIAKNLLGAFQILSQHPQFYPYSTFGSSVAETIVQHNNPSMAKILLETPKFNLLAEVKKSPMFLKFILKNSFFEITKNKDIGYFLKKWPFLWSSIIKSNNIEFLKKFLEIGKINPIYRDAKRNTFLTLAGEEGFFEGMLYLSENYPFDVNAENFQKMTPLRLSSTNQNTIKKLLKNPQLNVNLHFEKFIQNLSPTVILQLIKHPSFNPYALFPPNQKNYAQVILEHKNEFSQKELSKILNVLLEKGVLFGDHGPTQSAIKLIEEIELPALLQKIKNTLRSDFVPQCEGENHEKSSGVCQSCFENSNHLVKIHDGCFSFCKDCQIAHAQSLIVELHNHCPCEEKIDVPFSYYALANIGEDEIAAKRIQNSAHIKKYYPHLHECQQEECPNTLFVHPMTSSHLQTCTMCQYQALYGELSEDEKLLQEWQNQNSKKCPRCQTHIEKNRGCQHMTCGHCRHQFIWDSLQDYTKKCPHCRKINNAHYQTHQKIELVKCRHCEKYFHWDNAEVENF